MLTSAYSRCALEQDKKLAWIVCFSAALFFFYEFIQMNMFNAISADLMRAFSLNATGLGKLSAYYFYANLLFLPVAGTLLDRFSTRKIILFSLLLCIIGIATFAMTHSFFLAALFRFMSGIGSAFCFLSSIRLASRWFPAENMALVSGLIVTMAMLGGMVAQTPLTLLVEFVGWRYALLFDASLGIVIFLIIFSLVRDYPENSKQEQKKMHQELSRMGLLKSWRLAYFNPQNSLCGLYVALLNLPMVLLGSIWGGMFLQQAKHFSATEASFAPSLLFVGTILGGPVVGWVSDKFQKRIPLMMLGVIISFVLIIAIIGVPMASIINIALLFFALGFFTSTQVLSYPLVAASNPKSITATSVSVVS
ncbi:MFS transporter, partial [Rickettsiella grylli]|uniref:MFS transporter n=1 Tax=Rickettsiella grylli TaxID=59196 RepID=UPI0008FD244F